MSRMSQGNRSHRANTQKSYIEDIKLSYMETPLESNSKIRSSSYNTNNDNSQQILKTLSNDIPFGLNNQMNHYNFDYGQLDIYYEPSDGFSKQKSGTSNGIESKLLGKFNSYNKNTNSISQIYSYIQKPVEYESLPIQKIKKQRHILEMHVKFLNKQLNQILKSHLANHKKQPETKNKRHKISKSFDNELSDSCAQKQLINNRHLLTNMKKQYASLKHKLSAFEGCQSKISNQEQISYIRQEIRKAKLDLVQRKHKIVLQEKKIKVKKDTEKQKQYFNMQRQFVALSKKKQNYLKKIQKLQLQNAQLAENEQETQNKFSRIRQDIREYNKSISKTGENQHNLMLYETNKKKMELAIRKRQRNEETLQRKYYQLLKQFQKMSQRLNEKYEKVQNFQRKIESIQEVYKRQKQKIVKNKSEQQLKDLQQIKVNQIWKAPSEGRSESQQQECEEFEQLQVARNGFLLTEPDQTTTKVKSKRTTTKISRNKYQIKNRYKTEQEAPSNIMSQSFKSSIKIEKTQPLYKPDFLIKKRVYPNNKKSMHLQQYRKADKHQKSKAISSMNDISMNNQRAKENKILPQKRRIRQWSVDPINKQKSALLEDDNKCDDEHSQKYEQTHRNSQSQKNKQLGLFIKNYRESRPMFQKYQEKEEISQQIDSQIVKDQKANTDSIDEEIKYAEDFQVQST